MKHLLVATIAAAGLGSGMAAATAAPGASTPTAVPAAQQGYDTIVCHTDTAYIYSQQSTSSTRLDSLPRGAHFQVYNPMGTWDFGVRNYNGVSGNVLASQLCRTGARAVMTAAVNPVAGAPSALAALSAPKVAASKTGVTPTVTGTLKCVRTDVGPDIYIRNYPAGLAIYQLYPNEHFSIYEFRASGWVRGYAYGGWDSDRSGYAAPYDDVWTWGGYLTSNCP